MKARPLLADRPAELCVLFACHHLLLALPVRFVARLLLSDEVKVVRKGVVSIQGELFASWNLGTMLGLGSVGTACMVLALPHAGAEVRIALYTGPCLRVQRFRCADALPVTLFQGRLGAFPGAFDAADLRRNGDEASVALWLEPSRLLTSRELEESLARVASASAAAGAS
jgi:hypothetical protein